MPLPELQKKAPFFKGIAVIDKQFKEISLDDYKGKYLVLFFYPLDFTFVCPTEIIAFSDRVKEFKSIGCEVVAASCDSHFSHLAWINVSRKEGGVGDLQIPLLSDKSFAIANSYGVLDKETGIPFRGLFIIDGKQVLRQITVNDLPVGRSVDETLRLVQAFQYTDVHGEVCPANWKPGSKTMKPTPKESLDYFKNSVTLHTDVGDIKIELFCEACPKACENFLALCASDYYKGCTFHRNIKGFIVQTGDPTQTGKGGNSIFGKKFEDEFREELKHTARGMVSMANNGPNTNGSQFFIIYGPQPHLDLKYTLFGKVIDGFDALDELEKLVVNPKNYRPLADTKINEVTIHANPLAG